MNEQSQLAALRSMLRAALGPTRALTINRIGVELGHRSRRHTETFLEIHLQDIGFCVVSGSTGYYRPETPDDINHYLRALMSRIKCLAIRRRNVARAAAGEGWPRDPASKDFTQYHQPSLI